MSSPYSPRPVAGQHSGAAVVAFIAVGLMAFAGIISVVALAFGTGGAAHAAGPSAASGSANRPVPAQHATVPSSSIETVQRQLAQLNYYQGSIDGYLNNQTVQAITYLQRDAHLPQTGHLDQPTQAALTRMLADGNNQMNPTGP